MRTKSSFCFNCFRSKHEVLKSSELLLNFNSCSDSCVIFVCCHRPPPLLDLALSVCIAFIIWLWRAVFCWELVRIFCEKLRCCISDTTSRMALRGAKCQRCAWQSVALLRCPPAAMSPRCDVLTCDRNTSCAHNYKGRATDRLKESLISVSLESIFCSSCLICNVHAMTISLFGPHSAALIEEKSCPCRPKGFAPARARLSRIALRSWRSWAGHSSPSVDDSGMSSSRSC